MNAIVVIEAIATALAVINKLTLLVASLKEQINSEIPDEQLRLESFEETVARLKSEGKIPADYVPPSID